VRVGLFGGTFDPIHRGHVEVARRAADAFDLEEVLLIPSGQPPHRRPAHADYEHRYRMVALACQGDPRLHASRLEAPNNQKRPHYSIDTIQRVLREGPPGQRLFFLIGADAFAEIHLWHRWREIFDLVEFIVVSRPGSEPAASTTPPGACVHWFGEVEVPISSTRVREKLTAGEAVDEWVPAEVAKYIREKGLYKASCGASS
jgi:nicotinate-nucleotide adenylyltransferase